jgi:ribonuclease-3
MPSESPVDRLCERLGYRFRAPTLLVEALTHKSHLNEAPDLTRRDNERLEFLGDAVLDLVISEHFLQRFPQAPEGELSKLKSQIVNEAALARAAWDLDLGTALALGRGEELTGGRQKPSLLADALEAVIAAVYLDGGLDAARGVILRTLQGVLADQSRSEATDYKTELQEWCQRRFDVLPAYTVVRETGPDHRKTFEVRLTIRGELYGTGNGLSKKEAEQQAAGAAMEKIKQSPP